MNIIEGNTESIRRIYSTDDFDGFFNELTEKVQEKFRQSFDVVKTVYVLNTKLVKKLSNTNLYEMRVSVGSNEYKTVLFAIDTDNIILSTKVILLNGFLKKSTKDYGKQIAKAERILKDLSL